MRRVTADLDELYIRAAPGARRFMVAMGAGLAATAKLRGSPHPASNSPWTSGCVVG